MTFDHKIEGMIYVIPPHKYNVFFRPVSSSNSNLIEKLFVLYSYFCFCHIHSHSHKLLCYDQFPLISMAIFDNFFSLNSFSGICSILLSKKFDLTTYIVRSANLLICMVSVTIPTGAVSTMI